MLLNLSQFSIHEYNVKIWLILTIFTFSYVSCLNITSINMTNTENTPIGSIIMESIPPDYDYYNYINNYDYDNSYEYDYDKLDRNYDEPDLCKYYDDINENHGCHHKHFPKKTMEELFGSKVSKCCDFNGYTYFDTCEVSFL